MSVALADLARTTLSESVSSTDTQIRLTDPSEFEDPATMGGPVELLIWDASGDPSLAGVAREIVLCTGIVGDVATIVRKPGAIAHPQGRSVAVSMTARNIRSSTFLNALDFGADPSGTQDSAPALQAAFDALPSSGGTLVIPRGTYRQDRGVRLSDRDNVRVLADGVTWIYEDSVAEDNSMYGLYILRCDHVDIEGLTIDGRQQNRVLGETPSGGVFATHLFFVYSSSHVLIDRCRALNGGADGFYVGTEQPFNPAGKRAEHVEFRNCVATGCRRNGGTVANATDVIVGGGYYAQNGGKAPGAGWDVEPTYGSDPNTALFGSERVRFFGVDFEDNEGYGLLIVGTKKSPDDQLFVRDVSAISCSFHGNTGGSYVAHVFIDVASRVSLGDCTFEGSSVTRMGDVEAKNCWGFTVDGCDFQGSTAGNNAVFADADCARVSVADNDIVDWNWGMANVAEAIQVDADGASVVDNRITDCGGWGINLTLAKDARCSGNELLRCTGRGIVAAERGPNICQNVVREMQGAGARCISVDAAVRRAMIAHNTCIQEDAVTGDAIWLGSELVGIVGPNIVEGWSVELRVRPDGDPNTQEKAATEIFGSAGAQNLQTATTLLTSGTNKVVTFPQEFAARPKVQVTPNVDSSGVPLAFYATVVEDSITATGFEFRTNGGRVDLDSITWLAIGTLA